MTGDAKGEYRGTGYRNDAELKAWLAKRPSEPALEPDLPIIDPHHHFWDTPQRVVSSGWTPIPIWGLLLSGFFEYHTGFPFSVLNEQQQLVGAPNRMRFPNYFSLNLGLEKRFRFQGHEWAVRVTGVNITRHNNPNSVVNNIDAPNYLTYAGGQQRAFTVRLRLVTQH